MDAAERTEMAIVITKQLFASMSEDPLAMAFMTYFEIGPEEIEDTVYQILEYREKTRTQEDSG